MGLKGKLISSIEVKCGGHLVHDIFHAKTHHISNISPSKVKSFEIHEGESVDVGSMLNGHITMDGKYKTSKQVIEAVDHETKASV
ncbi:hypothetical protein MTR67_016271 [Solanum verrucosum]|uniref:Bet v I/Major latex protein domain-containing protein n=1 Tax=Solanum verrucosum TaxID=315347 RepID=A0AAF0QLL9_SOLVR|nr:hypothetical protein MTR67_016271 [Solanum verrucosum]